MTFYLAPKALNSGDAVGGALVETSLVTKNRLCDRGQAPGCSCLTCSVWLFPHVYETLFTTCLSLPKAMLEAL